MDKNLSSIAFEYLAVKNLINSYCVEEIFTYFFA
jgi:hypothetical protein